MEARIQARVHHAVDVGDHRLCLGSRSVVAERHPGFPSRRRSDADELAMDLVRHHADEPNPNGDRTTIGRKRLPRTAGKMEQPSCGTDRPGSCSDAIIPVGAGVGRPRPTAIARRRLSERPCATKESVLQRIPVLDVRRRPDWHICARDALQNLLVDRISRFGAFTAGGTRRTPPF
jgi:hypothetical protein